MGLDDDGGAGRHGAGGGGGTKSFWTTLTDEGLVGGVFIGGSAFVGGGIFTGGGAFVGEGAFIDGGCGGCHGSLGGGGMNSSSALGGAAGGGVHAGKFAQGFSSESLDEKVELSSSPWMRSYALFRGLADSAVFTLGTTAGIGGGAGRGCRFTSCNCLFTLSSAILKSFASNSSSKVAFSVRSSRTRFAFARRHLPGVSVAPVALSMDWRWDPFGSVELADVNEEMTHVCSSVDAPCTSFREFLIASRRF